MPAARQLRPPGTREENRTFLVSVRFGRTAAICRCWTSGALVTFVTRSVLFNDPEWKHQTGRELVCVCCIIVHSYV